MSRYYIDADRLHEEVDMFCRIIGGDRIHKSGIHAMIENMNTADVVEVVRCKDCKYDNCCMTQFFVAENGCIPLDKSTFFCSDAVFERKNKNEI